MTTRTTRLSPPPDGARRVAAALVAVWAVLAAVLLATAAEYDERAAARVTQFQALVGTHAPGASPGALDPQALLPGMTCTVGPSDHLLLPGGVAIRSQGPSDAFPYRESLTPATTTRPAGAGP